MPLWGRPPGAHLGRQTRRRGGPWVENDRRVEEINNEAESQLNLRDDRLLVGSDGWRRSMTERGGHNHALGQFDGADYDIYEDTDTTVAYAVQLAMKDNEEWLVEKALERIRRAHAEGQKNVTLSKRELEALERKRLQEAPKPPVETKRLSGAAWRIGATTTTHPPPYPLDTSVHGAWARTTGSAVSAVSPQSSTTTLRSPMQPPFPGSANHAPAFLAPPSVRRPYPDDYQRMPPYPVSLSREAVRSIHSPVDALRGSLTRPTQASYTDNAPRSSFVSADTPLSAPESAVSQNSDGKASPKRRSSANSSGDEVHIVEVMEHKVPSNSIGVAGKSRQPISRS
jgi:hypothetical protein